jgi:hypothetical protein
MASVSGDMAKKYRDDFGIAGPRSQLLKHLDNTLTRTDKFYHLCDAPVELGAAVYEDEVGPDSTI